VGYLLHRWEEVIRATVVIGLVGAGGLGRALTNQLSASDYRAVLTTLLVFVGLILLVDVVSAPARRAFRQQPDRRQQSIFRQVPGPAEILPIGLDPL
jgi:phosphonate transport system permease protein